MNDDSGPGMPQEMRSPPEPGEDKGCGLTVSDWLYSASILTAVFCLSFMAMVLLKTL